MQMGILAGVVIDGMTAATEAGGTTTGEGMMTGATADETDPPGGSRFGINMMTDTLVMTTRVTAHIKESQEVARESRSSMLRWMI